ncbi:MAG: endonuclease/exonuclease/phosphatase family protein [Anaerolineales bacterium]
MFHKQRLKFVWVFLLLVVFFCLLAAFLWNVSQPGKTVEGCPKGCAREVERHPGPLRVVSLNMLHGYPDFENLSLRLDLIASEIHRLDADVVLLQETPWTRMRGNAAEYLARKLGYNYLYFRANGNHRLIFFEEGEAILSRFRLEDPHFTVLPPRAGLLENRITLGANALTPMGDVTFFVTHLTDKDPQDNFNQVESLRDFVEGNVKGLTVIAGDFNAQEDTQQITELAGNWTDAYRNAHPNDPGLTCCIDDLASGPGEPLEKRIDYIFLVSGKEKNEGIISVQQVFDRPFPAGNGWQWASDHTGLLVELEP